MGPPLLIIYFNLFGKHLISLNIINISKSKNVSLRPCRWDEGGMEIWNKGGNEIEVGMQNFFGFLFIYSFIQLYQTNE